MLPTEFGPWQTVYWWFRRFVRLLLFRTIHDVALMIDREASPSAAIIDSQTVKAPAARSRGCKRARIRQQRVVAVHHALRFTRGPRGER